jgi:hypothetical protein
MIWRCITRVKGLESLFCCYMGVRVATKTGFTQDVTNLYGNIA